ncbi:MAG: hypothetical protein NZ889_01165 [Candidatus Pacearchaeota archaeon]|nr:hypothetical protein [Candidatus Pacearchaeota archaeon]
MEEISLRGFDDLDEKEIDIIKKIVLNRIKKIKIPYQFLVINLKKHEHKYKHQTRITHELNADLFFSKGKAIAAKSEDTNLYKALEELLEKIIAETKHKFKK